MTAQSNGTISPQEAAGGSASFQYTPTVAGPGVSLSGSFRSTSTAGVAAGTWMQAIRAATINRISGTFNGTITMQTMLGPSVQGFSGSVTFDRFSPACLGGASGTYALSAGSDTSTFSGIDGSGATGCQMSGSGTFPLPTGFGAGSITVDGTPPDLEPPYTYGFLFTPSLSDIVTVTRHSCPMGGDGSTFPASTLLGAQNATPATSTDGLNYTGTQDQTFMGSGQILNWSFQGSE